MARKICNHPVFPDLRIKLTAVKVAVCPTCLLRLHVFEIAEIQTLMRQRGGIFTSKATAIAEQEKNNNNQEWGIHKALSKRWRLVRIAVYKDLSLLEDLRPGGVDKARWEVQLDKAFEFWHEVENECSIIPGYRYSEHDDYVVTGGKSDVQQDLDLECRLNEEKINEASIECSQIWYTVPPKQKTPTRVPRNPRASLAFILDPLGATDTEHATQPASAPAVKRPVALTSRGTDGVPSKVRRGSYWNGRNRFDLLREINADEDRTIIKRTEVNIPLPSSHPQEGVSPASSIAQSLPATSSLKRKRSSTSSSALRSRKIVQQADHITVICDASACGTSGLPPEQNSYKRPHFSYTTAEMARRRREFHRPSPCYVPSTWALSGEYENEDTSHYKTPWAQYKVRQHLDDFLEASRCQEGIDVLKGLKDESTSLIDQTSSTT